MKKKTVRVQVRIPSEWLKVGIDDIMVTAYASINDDGEEVYANVYQVCFPRWQSFNIHPDYQFQMYELIDQKCIDRYINEMDMESVIYESTYHE